MAAFTRHEQHELYRHAQVFAVAEFALERAEADEEGAQLMSIASIAFCYFAVEGLLNVLGQEVFARWSDIERSMSTEAKLEVLAREARLSVDFGKEPWQSYRKAKRLRNEIAHPKIERLSKTLELEALPVAPSNPQGRWERSISTAEARKIVDGTHQLAMLFWNGFNMAGDPFFVMGRVTGSTSGS